MHRALHIALLCLVLAALAGLSACGVSSAGVGASNGTPNTPVTLSPAPSATPKATASATSSSSGSSSGSASTGPVTVTVDQQHYGTKDTVVVRVTNGLSTNIYAQNHETACTIVTLEMSAGGTWQPAGECREGILTTFIPVRAGTSATFDLIPGGGQLKSGAWTAGTYRVVLHYTASNPDGSAAPPSSFNSAYSATFTIS